MTEETTGRRGSDATRRSNHPTIAVTGGARGIGRATATEAMHRGAHSVWLLDVLDSELEATRAELAMTGEAKVYARQLDVCDRQGVDALASEWRELESADVPQVLVNAAGVRAASSILEAVDDEWDRTICVNLTGTFNMLRMASRFWTQDSIPGVFVALASIGAEVGFSERVSYCASKAGVLGLVRAAALDLADRGIRVVGISPGFVATEISQDMDDLFVASTPAGRRFRPEELADVVLDAAGSRLISGTSIVADGGLLAGYRL